MLVDDLPDDFPPGQEVLEEVRERLRLEYDEERQPDGGECPLLLPAQLRGKNFIATYVPGDVLAVTAMFFLTLMARSMGRRGAA